MSGPLGNLPGFWYDGTRRKYFPGVPPAAQSAAPSVLEPSLGIRVDQVEAGPSRIAQPLRSRLAGRGYGGTRAQRVRSSALRLDLQQDAVLLPWSDDLQPTVTALAATSNMVFAGSESGWVSLLKKSQGRHYTRDTSLGGSITDIAVEGDTMLAVSFGPQPVQLVRNLRDAEGNDSDAMDPWRGSPRKIRTFRKGRDDVWCMALKGGAATFGGNGWVAHASVVGDPSTYDKAAAGSSDVLSMTAVDRDNVYTGQRSGNVVHYDFRVPGTSMLFSRKTPVTSLRKIDSVVGGLVVAGLKDELSVYDVRFANDPVMQLQGHCNKHSLNLAFTTTPDDETVIAAGSDGRIRAWSVSTGEQLAGSKDGPLGVNFETPVQAVTWSDDDLLVGGAAVVQVFSRSGFSEWGAPRCRD